MVITKSKFGIIIDKETFANSAFCCTAQISSENIETYAS